MWGSTYIDSYINTQGEGEVTATTAMAVPFVGTPKLKEANFLRGVYY